MDYLTVYYHYYLTRRMSYDVYFKTHTYTGELDTVVDGGVTYMQNRYIGEFKKTGFPNMTVVFCFICKYFLVFHVPFHIENLSVQSTLEELFRLSECEGNFTISTTPRKTSKRCRKRAYHIETISTYRVTEVFRSRSRFVEDLKILNATHTAMLCPPTADRNLAKRISSVLTGRHIVSNDKAFVQNDFQQFIRNHEYLFRDSKCFYSDAVQHTA